MRKDKPPAVPVGVLTIGDAIAKLQRAAATSPLGDDTVFCVCIHDLEYQPVTDIKLDASKDGGVALAMIGLDLGTIRPSNEVLAG